MSKLTYEMLDKWEQAEFRRLSKDDDELDIKGKQLFKEIKNGKFLLFTAMTGGIYGAMKFLDMGFSIAKETVNVFSNNFPFHDFIEEMQKKYGCDEVDWDSFPINEDAYVGPEEF